LHVFAIGGCINKYWLICCDGMLKPAAYNFLSLPADKISILCTLHPNQKHFYVLKNSFTMIIVKLGGSIICNKNEPLSFNEGVVKQIAEEIADFYPEKKFLLVHGGGSYGHPLAKEYKIREGLKKENMVGVSKTHQAMLELNKKIIEIFLSLNLPAFSISPSSIFIINEGQIVDGWVKVIEGFIARDFIPVLFGDVAIAKDKGIDILSGDQIISYLAGKLQPERVIFLMDVDGIYDKNPKVHRDARLIEEINEEISLSLRQEAAGIDVTGGVRNKIDEALKIPCPVYFINGMVKGNLTKAIKGERVGTIIKRMQ